MIWAEAEIIARGGVAVRQRAWLTDPRFVNSSIVYSAGAGSTRAVAVFRKNGTEVVVRPGFALEITGDATTGVLTSTKAMQAGDEVYFTSLAGGAGLSLALIYFVRDVAGLTFKIAATDGGAAVNFSSDITSGTMAGGHFGASQFLADDWEVA